ncbi:MAG TPA: hypothetical protein V6C89_11655 [Drouetiella sp.]|jgi:hypothetical protein
MFNNKVAGNLSNPEDAQSLIADLTQRSFHIPASAITVQTNVAERYEYTDQNYLLKLFSAWMALGTLIGVGYAVQFLHPAGAVAMVLASVSYGIFGAAAGQLVAGLSDVVFNGSLDDRLNVDEPAVYTITADVPADIEPSVERVMNEIGATAIHTLSA